MTKQQQEIQSKIDQIITLFNGLVEESKEGANITALETLALIKDCKLLDLIKLKVNEIERYGFEEIPNYQQGNEKTIELNGFKFEPRNGGRYYEFKHLEKWQERKKNVDEYARKELKDYEAKLIAMLVTKTSSVGNTEMYNEDGELVELEDLPKMKYKKSSIVVKPVK